MLTAKNTITEIRELLKQQNMKQISELIMNIARLGNKYISIQEPWNLIKSKTPADRDRFDTVVYTLVETMRIVGIYLEPIIPATCERYFNQLGVPKEFQTYASINTPITPGFEIGTPSPLFPKIEIEEKKG